MSLTAICRRACFVLRKGNASVHFLQLMPEEKKLTTTEAAEILGAAESTIRKRCIKGKFPNAEKIIHPRGDYWVIPESDLNGVIIKMGRPKKDQT